jgi:hypothetical protein
MNQPGYETLVLVLIAALLVLTWLGRLRLFYG